MENISHLLITAVPALFTVFLVLSLIVRTKASRLSKKTSCLFAILSVLGSFFWLLFIVCLITNVVLKTHANITKLASLMFFFLFSSHTFCEYGVNRAHDNLLRIALCLDSCAVLIIYFVLAKGIVSFSTAPLCVISIVETILIILNIVTIISLRKMTPYMYMTIHGNTYHVYNEIEPSFGKDMECYTTITIPLVDNASIEQNTFIKDSDDDKNMYVIKIKNNVYEVRNDKPITVKENGDICLVTITANQMPISVVNREMVNILL